MMRERKPTEHVYFEINPYPLDIEPFVPAPDLPPNVTACSTGGWSADHDPKGLNLRSGPSSAAKVVATLPGPRGGYGIEFRIVGFEDGWFLIEHAEDPDYDDKAPAGQTVYAGRGWVSGRLVTSSIAAGSDLMASPHYDAATILTLSGETGGVSYGADSVPIKRILGCREGWTRVEVEDPPTRLTMSDGSRAFAPTR